MRAIENNTAVRFKMLAASRTFSPERNGFDNHFSIVGNTVLFADIEGKAEGIGLDSGSLAYTQPHFKYSGKVACLTLPGYRFENTVCQ